MYPPSWEKRKETGLPSKDGPGPIGLCNRGEDRLVGYYAIGVGPGQSGVSENLIVVGDSVHKPTKP